MKNRNHTFTSVVWKEGKHVVAQCLNADVSSFGKTKTEALKNLEEALELYLEDARRPLPDVESPAIILRSFQHA